MVYNLKSTKLYSFDDFQKNIKQQLYGVYIWGFKNPELYNNRFLVYYVGRRYSSIKDRIFEHREKHLKHDTHNIFKKEFIKDYFNIVWFKSDFYKNNNYEAYKDKYAFLNADEFGKPINKKKKILKSENETKFNTEVQPHIDYYVNNFYACCIPLNDIVESNHLDEKEKRRLIDELEKYIQELIPHKLSTKKIGKSKQKFNVDFSSLGEDDFTLESYKNALNIKNGI
ncbi:MAG TPA: hypothetical protein PK546_03740 [Chitinophagales bacterium]|jgi:hypothetical protein|nr:hypothetical protein [Chitinophagales bacterium]